MNNACISIKDHICNKKSVMNSQNQNNSNNTDTEPSSDTTSSDDETIELNVSLTRQPLCKCTNNDIKHVEIKFFNKTKIVCLNNKDDRCVINLSSHDLTETERSVLLKGLTFCPTPGEPVIQDIKNDLKAFFRRLKIKHHYYDEEAQLPPMDPSQTTLDSFLTTQGTYQTHVDVSKFKPKSKWEPENVDPAIETFCRAILNEVSHFKPMQPRSNNLTPEEKVAKQNLHDNTSIEIKKADKGAATVVMDKSDYIKEAHRQLSDTNFYVKQSANLTEHFSEKIGDILISMSENGELDGNTFESLLPAKCRTPQIYFLPKIHKKLVVARPIISGNGCPTEQISAFVDEHIKQYVPLIPSFVRDTKDFIRKIEEIKADEKLILVTLDVSALYTNIPNNEGKRAIYRTLIENNYDGKVSINSIMKLLTCVLQMNNFEFCDEQYLQVGGTAMGTRLAPSYASLFLSNLEKKLLADAPCRPVVYLRFRDDIFCVFREPRAKIEEFIEYMNSSHDTIKFTAEISENEVTFLDTKVKKDPVTHKIYTELYTKDTDTQNYLSFDSCHPKHCKTGGPYGEFLRIRRNCYKLEDYDRHSAQRVKDYQRRGYPTKLLEEARTKARNLNRATLLADKSKEDVTNKRIPLVVTYNPANPHFQQMIDKHWHLLQLSSKNEVFKEKPLISYKRNKNLGDLLVRAKCTTETSKPTHNPNIHPCKTPWNCAFCPKKNIKTFKSTTTGRCYKRPPYTCNTRNVVYLITCNLCKKQYVGETHRSFRERMIEHERYVKKKIYTQATGLHYNTSGHKLGHMNFEVIYCLWKKPISRDPVRIAHEIRWMEQLKTFKPDGLNVKGK